MATEYESLRLNVSLVDNVTSQLEKIRGSLTNLGGGQAGAGLEKLKRQTGELTEQIKGLATGFGGGAEAALTAAKGLGLMTAGVLAGSVALVKGVQSLGEYTRAMQALGTLARQTGIGAAQIKELTEAFERSGVDAGKAQANISGLAHAMADITRVNSEFRQKLLAKAGQGSDRAAMEALLGDLGRVANDPAAFVRKLREAQDQIYNSMLTRTGSSQRAAEARARFLADIGMPELAELRGDIANVSREMEDMMASRIAQSRELGETTAIISQSWAKISDAVKALATPAVTAVLRPIAEALRTSAEQIETALEAIRNFEPPEWMKTIGRVVSSAGGAVAGGLNAAQAASGAAGAATREAATALASNIGQAVKNLLPGGAAAAAAPAVPEAAAPAIPMGMGGRGGGAYGQAPAASGGLWSRAKGLVGRQGGGPLGAGELSVVGEGGPELFAPGQSGSILPNAIYAAALAAEYGFGVRGASTAAAGALRGHAGASKEHGIGEVLAGGIPGASILQAMKRDAEGGHSLRTKLRAMLGLEDPGEAAPWQTGGQWKRQAGGPVTGGTVGLVGEAGPELFMGGGQGGGSSQGARLLIEQNRQTQELNANTEDQNAEMRRLVDELRTLNQSIAGPGGTPGAAGPAAGGGGGAGGGRGGVRMGGLGGVPGFGGMAGGGFRGGGGSAGGGGASGSWAAPSGGGAAGGGGATPGSGAAGATGEAAPTAGQAGTGSGKAAAEAYLGRSISTGEYDQLMRATHAESGAKNSPEEQAMIMGTILNRARKHPGGITGALTAKNQFQAVTGTKYEPGPSRNYRQGPSESRRGSIEGAAQNLLHRVPTSQTNFTAASRAAYGAGTNVGYLDQLQRTGGAVYGGTQFGGRLAPGGVQQPAGAGDGGGAPAFAPPGELKMGAEANQANRPGYIGGQVDVGGQTFNWGSGGGGRGSLPYGTYPINVGDVSASAAQRLGSIASVGGKGGGTIDDPKYPGKPRTGIHIHTNRREQLDALYSAGCFTVPKSQWPQFRQALLDQAAKTPGGLHLQVNRDGRAVIGSREEIANRARGGTAGTGGAPGASGDPLAQAAAPAPDVSAPVERSSMDRAMGREMTHKVEGTGKLQVDVSAPAGTKVAAEGGGLFKKVETNRQTQMTPAAEGPRTVAV